MDRNSGAALLAAGAGATALLSLLFLLRERRLRQSDRAQLQAALESLKDIHRSNPLQFTVGQYNILAGYLGENTAPWFLYGADGDLDLEVDEVNAAVDGPCGGALPTPPLTRRQRIFERFYARDAATGELLNKGWPKYVRGILSAEEQAAVEARDRRDFSWDRGGRGKRLLSTILRLDADILSLVECDHFEDFFRPELGKRGYGGVRVLRPREGCLDGSAIFWRTSKFSLAAQRGVHFTDSVCPKTGRERKDRCAMFALLKSTTHVEPCDQWRHHRGGAGDHDHDHDHDAGGGDGLDGEHHHSAYVVAVSVHLARNPDDPRQDEVRARQVAQLFRELTHFVAAEAAKLDGGRGGGVGEARGGSDSHPPATAGRRALAPGNPIANAPVVLMGDLNATQFDRLKGLVLALGEITGDPVHPFLWEAMDVPTRSTSVTTARDVRIDALFYPTSSLELVEAPMLPLLSTPIPDRRHPSDHLPVRATFKLRTGLEKSLSLARAWFVTVSVSVCCLAATAAAAAAAAEGAGGGVVRPLGFGGGKENKTKGSKKGRKSKNSKRATPKESGGAAKQQQALPAFISPTFNEIFDTQTPLARPRASSSSAAAGTSAARLARGSSTPLSPRRAKSDKRKQKPPPSVAELGAEALSKVAALGSTATSHNRPLSADELSNAWVLFDWDSEHELTLAKLQRASTTLSLGFSEELLQVVFGHLADVARARKRSSSPQNSSRTQQQQEEDAAADEGKGGGGGGGGGGDLPNGGRTTPVMAWGEEDDDDDSSDDSSDDDDDDDDDDVDEDPAKHGPPEKVGFAEFVVAYDMALRTAQFDEARPDLVEAFRSFDTNGDGQIDEHELFDALQRFSPLRITREDCRRFLNDMDMDGDGAVDYEEFASRVVSSHLTGKLTFEDLATTTTSLRVRQCLSPESAAR